MGARTYYAPSKTGTKFWRITRIGKKTVTKFGPTGAKGQVRRKTLESEEAAREYAVRKTRSKRLSGYATTKPPEDRRKMRARPAARLAGKVVSPM
jgi:predicted DNA-binding WGR domain protein